MANHTSNLKLYRNSMASGNPEFPSGDRTKLQKLWEETREAESYGNKVSVSEQETELALHNVHQRLGFNKKKETGGNNRNGGSSGGFTQALYFLAAAAAVIITGFTWLSLPVHISTAPGQTTAVTLSDGSTITLNSGSVLTKNRMFGHTNRNLALNGEAYFEVENGSTPFTVSANGSVTRVTGTSFNIRSWASDPAAETVITVTSGEVSFYHERHPERPVHLTEGLSSSLSSLDPIPATPSSAAVAYALAWKNHSLAFSGQPLTVIFDELERRFNIRIQWDDPEIGMTRLSTFITDPENAESVISDICFAKGLTYSRTNNGFRITKSGK